MRLLAMFASAAVLAGCATRTGVHAGPTGLSSREQQALLTASRVRPDGFERFWLRPNCRFGLVKWSDQRSQAVSEAPKELLQVVRDEFGRVNRNAGGGEEVYVSVVVFEWERRYFGRPPRAGYEILGRDRAGQIIWFAVDWLTAPRDLAQNLAEPDELLLAREMGRKLRAELGR
jgi:hypothetical protein